MRALAAPGTIAHMHEQLKPEMSEGIWLTHLPGGQIPPLRLVVAGDAVYGDVHQYFGEATTVEKRKEWLRVLDRSRPWNRIP
ncbi:uncharacterized protein ANIA_11550 [Aspergillus nidulans FGSC A4]|uniref:Uncharacterized protein n=1 Tax=Emericella nidulans (strain FGSC A4 / ATCC 38163 / CBS 112.46 / NRRL 194 / M139) TaxID=227321 RepID=C8VCZ8_EMENI|nr:hypothetical protein [Aspergillus nidulans FGSC A4]CBF78835.1 TPA: hypothetical protein ANIA_11550 [Aspergillus nidulans FGSC A4]